VRLKREREVISNIFLVAVLSANKNWDSIVLDISRQKINRGGAEESK
jgi:hypothetical protein